MPKARLGARRTLFAVIGMHRSGTSALARVMNLLGPPLPEPLLLGMPDNPLGHWEPLELLDLDTKALAAAGCTWHSGPLEAAGGILAADPALRRQAVSFLCRCFSRGNLSALIKDPRQTATLPSWLEIARELGIEVKVALIFRNPVDVAQSLNARDGLAIAEGFDLWHRYNQLGEAYTRDTPRIVVDYEDLRASPDVVVDRLVNFMGDTATFDQAAAQSVAPSASARRAGTDAAGDISAEIAEAFETLQVLAKGGPDRA